jgi:hypothetical protein
MFLNRLKAKSIIRKLEKANSERIPVTVGNDRKTVCIIETENHKFNRQKLKQLARVLNVNEENIQFRSFIKQIKKEDKDEPELFSANDIGWNGVFKASGLKEFKKTNFDILISYYTQAHLAVSAVSSLGRAKFKVGLGEDLYQTHDLSLEVPVGETDLFLSELEKYLKILKII